MAGKPRYERDRGGVLSFVSAFVLVRCYKDLRVVGGVVHLRNKGLVNDCRKQSVALQIAMPVGKCYGAVRYPRMIPPMVGSSGVVHPSGGRRRVLLIVTSARLDGCLRGTFSVLFEVALLRGPRRVLRFSKSQLPSVVIVSRAMGNVHNGRVYSGVGSGADVIRVPIVLLVDGGSGKDCLTRTSYKTSGLRPHTVGVYELGVSVRVLVGGRRHVVGLLRGGLSSGLPSPATGDRRSALFVGGIGGLLRGGLSARDCAISVLDTSVKVYHAGFCAGVGRVASGAPARCVRCFGVGGTGVLLIARRCAIARVTAFLNFYGTGCFKGQFGGFCGIPPARCVGRIFWDCATLCSFRGTGSRRGGLVVFFSWRTCGGGIASLCNVVV